MTVLADRASKAAPMRAAVTGSTVAPKRRWSLLVGGVLLVLVCAGIFAVVQLSGDARVQVLAVARPVAAGQVINAGDLRVVRVVPDPSVPLVRAGDLSQIVGRTAAVPLAVGSLLAESQMGSPAWPQAGQAVVAVALKPGRVPAGLAPGSHVRIVTVAKDNPADATAFPAAPVSVPATVVAVLEDVDGSGTSVVSLLLAQDDATKVAGSGSELALVLVGR